jgi:hypothetical protein
VACGLTPARELCLGSELSFKAGLLVKNPSMPHVFRGEKSASRFIGKTRRTVQRLNNAPFDATALPKLRALLEPGIFAIRPVEA